MPALALCCTKHDSYDAWYKKGLIKIEKDRTVTCNATALGAKNCEAAMPYVYRKYLRR
jgi:hypothetical protein